MLFIIALQYAVVRRQISSGTFFFSFASPTPGYYRNGDFQAITSFKIPEKVQYGTKLVSTIVGSSLETKLGYDQLGLS